MVWLGLGQSTLVDQELQLIDTSADPRPLDQLQNPSYHK